MKVAIMLYGTRVSPRFGYSQGVMVVEVSGHQEIHRKTLETGDYYPEQIPTVLGNEGVEVVISGGCLMYERSLLGFGPTGSFLFSWRRPTLW